MRPIVELDEMDIICKIFERYTARVLGKGIAIRIFGIIKCKQLILKAYNSPVYRCRLKNEFNNNSESYGTQELHSKYRAEQSQFANFYIAIILRCLSVIGDSRELKLPNISAVFQMF
ncbi:hypothetical protein LOAG_05863 [Loa loa]|uniref:Uncharacterized protein n=1 Tax=Loa loa TaxID=7209 RepID=A0A1S0TZ97_LOALO|nr:hypothetical protein LOAG_05863 [Loa loa]EFO22621.1 hypothetical protein LOAG_05863 [Loa loa]